MIVKDQIQQTLPLTPRNGADRARLKTVCLIGTSYTGGVLLALLMNSHPQISGVGEGLSPPIFRRRRKTYPCSCGRVVVQCPFWRRLEQAVNDQGVRFRIQDFNLGYMYQNRWLNRVFSRYRHYPMVGSLVPKMLMHCPLHHSHMKKATEVNTAFIRSVLEITGADVFFYAGKNLTGHLQLLRSRQLEVKFIRIVRDVRSFASSYKKRGRPIEKAVRVWKNFQASADHFTRAHSPVQTVKIRYENLCRDPGQCMQQLYDFVGVDRFVPPSVLIPRDHHITGHSMLSQRELSVRLIEEWKSILTSEEEKRVLHLAGNASH